MHRSYVKLNNQIYAEYLKADLKSNKDLPRKLSIEKTKQLRDLVAWNQTS